MNSDLGLELIVFIAPIAAFITAFISGMLGMAGGVLLMGAFISILPVSAAMVLHGITQLSGNAFSAYLFRKEISWRSVLLYLAGALASLAIVSYVQFTPHKSLIFITLGTLPLTALAAPRALQLDFARSKHALICGLVTNTFTLTAGSGAGSFDLFFIRSRLTKGQVIGTKSATMVLSQSIKIIYYGILLSSDIESKFPIYCLIPALIISVAMGRLIGKYYLDRLNECQFRSAGKIVLLGMGILFVGRGVLGT